MRRSSYLWPYARAWAFTKGGVKNSMLEEAAVGDLLTLYFFVRWAQ